jgi:hypothetical protein
VCLGKVWIQRECLAVAGNGFTKLAQGTIRFTQVVMEERGISVDTDRASNIFNGNLVLSPSGSDHAEKMERIGLIRLDRKDLPIDVLGSMEATVSIVLDCNR